MRSKAYPFAWMLVVVVSGVSLYLTKHPFAAGILAVLLIAIHVEWLIPQGESKPKRNLRAYQEAEPKAQAESSRASAA